MERINSTYEEITVRPPSLEETRQAQEWSWRSHYLIGGYPAEHAEAKEETSENLAHESRLVEALTHFSKQFCAPKNQEPDQRDCCRLRAPSSRGEHE